MKKILAATAAVMLCLSVGCGKKTSKASEKDAGETTSASAEITTEALTGEPDPLFVTTTAVQTTASGSVKTTTTTASTGSSAKPVQPDPLGGGVFKLNEDGAVVFSEDSSSQEDTVLISAAQTLFESACRTEWKYTVGCPYELDPADYVENEFGWQYHRIKNDSIKSMDDLRADYNKVFSGRYPDQLSDIYVEENGSVYAMEAARGRDLYYTDSRITGIKSKSDDEIVFTVENNYTGTDFEPDKPVTQTEEFSVIIDNNGTWKVGQFRLPY
ncbi:MAG: hypothetical protein GXY08_09660 [Ruminococcus sp.]|nr:hypothetical protein [Ruminococcus sp.]